MFLKDSVIYAMWNALVEEGVHFFFDESDIVPDQEEIRYETEVKKLAPRIEDRPTPRCNAMDSFGHCLPNMAGSCTVNHTATDGE